MATVTIGGRELDVKPSTLGFLKRKLLPAKAQPRRGRRLAARQRAGGPSGDHRRLRPCRRSEGSHAGGSQGPVDERAELAQVYGRIIDATNWTFPEVDALMLDEVEVLVSYWRKAPPLADVVRAFAGVEVAAGDSVRTSAQPEAPFAPREVTEAEFANIVRAKAAFAEEFGRGNRP